MTRFTLARPLRAGLLIVAAVAAAAFLLVTPAVGAPPQLACDNRNNNTYDKLLECVRLEGVRAHQAAFQAIADANGDTRAARPRGTTRASTTWSRRSRRPAGGRAGRVHSRWRSRSSSTRRLGHARGRRRHGQRRRDGDRPGDPVDINLAPPRANTSGCDGAFTEAAVGAPLTADPAASTTSRASRPPRSR